MAHTRASASHLALPLVYLDELTTWPRSARRRRAAKEARFLLAPDMHRVFLATVAAFLSALTPVACGGSVAQVEDGKGSTPSSPSPSSTTTSPVMQPAQATAPPAAPPSPSSAPVVVLPVVASSYDQTCNSNLDCIAITAISDCGCACPNAAINVNDLAREQSDVDSHQAACAANHAPGCGAACAARQVYCDGAEGLVGTCRVAP